MRCLLNGLRTFARRFAFQPDRAPETLTTLPPSSAPTAAERPRYLVRACEFADSLNLVRDIEEAKKTIEELRGLAVDCLFADQRSDLSVYSATTADCFDAAHGLGIVARLIGGRRFDAEQREKHERQIKSWVAKEKNAKRPDPVPDKRSVSFTIPTAVLEASGVVIASSPMSNLNFAPADGLHHDLSFTDAAALGAALVEGIRSGEIRWACVHKEDFRSFASSALAACIQMFGDLSSGLAPATWRAGTALSADEQVIRLRHMAGDRIVKSWGQPTTA
jgi:hypothetical protein